MAWIVTRFALLHAGHQRDIDQPIHGMERSIDQSPPTPRRAPNGPMRRPGTAHIKDTASDITDGDPAGGMPPLHRRQTPLRVRRRMPDLAFVSAPGT